MKKVKTNETLYIIKCIACIAVVFIHVPFPGYLGNLLNILAQCAVPIFFMIAGYFSFNCNEEKIKKRIFKILKILLISYLLFFLFNSIFELQNGLDSYFLWLKNHFNANGLLHTIVFCDINIADPLWYLVAMLETYLLWLVILKLKLVDKAKYLYIVLFILQIGFAVISSIKNLDWTYKLVFIISALPWFLFGLHMNNQAIEKIKNHFIIIASIVGTTILVVSTIINDYSVLSSIGIVILSTSIFAFAIKYPNIKKLKIMKYIGANLSLYIYIFHTLIDSMLVVVLSKFIDTNNTVLSYLQPIIVLLLTTVFSLVLYAVLGYVKSKKKVN